MFSDVSVLFTGAGADPGPVVGGGTNPSKGGANLIYFIFFSEKPHERDFGL